MTTAQSALANLVYIISMRIESAKDKDDYDTIYYMLRDAATKAKKLSDWK